MKALGLCVGMLIMLLLAGCGDSTSTSAQRANMTVMLVPADGGTSDGTIADFKPLFDAVSRQVNIDFKISVGTSYVSVVEAMAADKIDIAFFGPVSFLLARERGAAELLAVGVQNGKSEYFSVLVTSSQSDIANIADLAGRSVALGDVNSTSSFTVPIKMLLDADLDPVRDVGGIYLLGNHASAIQAVAAARVDAAFTSADSYERFINNTASNASDFHIVSRSNAIPYPPLAVRPNVDAAIKIKLKTAIHSLRSEGNNQLRGYAGKPVDSFNAFFDEEEYVLALQRVVDVDTALKNAIIAKAMSKAS